MMTAWLMLLLGLVTLIVGGEFLVKGAVGIAHKFKVSTLVIGMTVVSFGTSAPELLVSLNAALGGNPEIAIGNVIGSNIANIALVLGITVLIFPLLIDRNTIRIDWPFMILCSLAFFGFALDGELSRIEGGILFAALVLFTVFLLRQSRKQQLQVKEENDGEVPAPPWKSLLFLALGLTGLKFGADWLLDNAVTIASDLGMTKHMIGVTIIAFGTSVPELVTSCVAAIKKETDISIGNLIGSNIFNIMAVLGLTSIVQPISVQQDVLWNDGIWMLLVAFLLLPFFLLGKRMVRWQGLLLFCTYLLYMYVVISKITLF